MTWQVFRHDPDYLAERADGLLTSAVAEFDRWSAPLTTDGARLVLARGHGFDDWASPAPGRYADLPEMARLLLDAGALTGLFARGDGGTTWRCWRPRSR